ncbi:MAG: PilZ domain-containing protein [Chloroflexi bacterium]|nr:PilZ domain-containing protein [Chloroflexota bacterium]
MFFTQTQPDINEGDEVEVAVLSEDGTSDVLIVNFLGIDRKRMLFTVPRKKYAIPILKTGLFVTVHLRRPGQLGTFQGKILEVNWNQTPAAFTVSFTEKISWENIDPSRLRLEEHPRLEIALSVEGEVAGEYFKAVTRNIGASGLVIISENALPEDQPLPLSISLPNRKISLTGRMVRMNREKGTGKKTKATQYEMEIYNEKMSPDDQEFLIRFVMERLSKKGSPLPGLKTPEQLI